MINNNLEAIIFVIAASILGIFVSAGFCVFCRKRKNQKNELEGVEGIVKLKHLDDSIVNISCDTNHFADISKNLTTSTSSDLKINGFESKRSLPDIPSEITVDNNSELYATVGEKSTDNHDGIIHTLNKAAETALINNIQHPYDKLKKGRVDHNEDIIDDNDEEDDEVIDNPIAHRECSSNNLLSNSEVHLDAYAAISGQISANNELPYMTPPVATPHSMQHFSGDSQDSSKGYTSISVREPLANIIAKTKEQTLPHRRKHMQDSHYATVSDDSDEMYAAIEDPNNAAGDLYTSGSETYAQIQTPVCMTVSVEINNTDFTHSNSVKNNNSNSNHDEYDSANQYHSRQASSSSCTNLIGSPKPEKRQANSPLPPTPPRNSAPFDHRDTSQSRLKDSNNNKARQDLEGMYAKVLKKSKLSNVPQSMMTDKMENFSDIVVHDRQTEEYGNENKKFSFHEDDLNDAGYETIPGDKNNNKGSANFSFALNQQKSARTSNITESGYEVVKKIESTTDSDYDPNYEIVMNRNTKALESRYSQIPEVTSINSNDYSQLMFNSLEADTNLYCSIPPIMPDPSNTLSTDSILEQNLSESSSKFTEHMYERLDEENSPDDFFKV